MVIEKMERVYVKAKFFYSAVTHTEHVAII